MSIHRLLPCFALLLCEMNMPKWTILDKKTQAVQQTAQLERPSDEDLPQQANFISQGLSVKSPQNLVHGRAQTSSSRASSPDDSDVSDASTCCALHEESGACAFSSAPAHANCSAPKRYFGTAPPQSTVIRTHGEGTPRGRKDALEHAIFCGSASPDAVDQGPAVSPSYAAEDLAELLGEGVGVAGPGGSWGKMIDLTNDSDSDRSTTFLPHLIEGRTFSMTRGILH